MVYLCRIDGVLRRGPKRHNEAAGYPLDPFARCGLSRFFIFRVQSSTGARSSLAFPARIILGTQSFRAIAELFLHQLWIDGLIPRMLIFEGASVDIYIGASAPFIAWLFEEFLV